MNNLEETEINTLLLTGITYKQARNEIFINAADAQHRTKNMMLSLLCTIQNTPFPMEKDQQ